jgi:hypothetical protein
LFDAARPVTQVELAVHVGLTQPAVSKALGLLRRNGAAVQADPGWLPDRRALLDAYVKGYAVRLMDADTLLYRIDPVRQQAESVAGELDDVVLSGDAAADRLSPWRLPTTLIAYTDSEPERLAVLGFVVADDRAVATLLVRPMPDRRFARDVREVDGVRVAHSLHLAADLLTLGSDRAEAAERIIAA